MLKKSSEHLSQFDYFNPSKVLQDIWLTDPQKEYYAEAFWKIIAIHIIKFEEELDEKEEVGAKLVTFGDNIIIHVEELGFWNPQLITFSGYTEDGKRVRLIQHINQISFLLMAVPRKQPERKRVGFKLKYILEEQKKKEKSEELKSK